MNKEMWKEIKGYEGLYKVSNQGRIKRLEHFTIIKRGSQIFKAKRRNKILKPTTNKNGYLVVGLVKDGVKKQFKIHRLVAEAFIPNLNNKPCVDHINTVKNDNRVENLRWCTPGENNKNGITNKKRSTTYSLYNHRSQKVICLEKHQAYLSIRDAYRKTGIDRKMISDCCKGIRENANNLHFKYI